MTRFFGPIETLTDEDLTILDTSSGVAGIMELHKVVEEDVQQIVKTIEGDFTIRASGSSEL